MSVPFRCKGHRTCVSGLVTFVLRVDEVGIGMGTVDEGWKGMWVYQYLMTSSSVNSSCKGSRSLSWAPRRRSRRVRIVPSCRGVCVAIALSISLSLFRSLASWIVCLKRCH